VLFPYGNKLVTRYLDNQLNERFGNEFAKILHRTYQLIKDNMLDPMPQMPGDLDDYEMKVNSVNQSKSHYWAYSQSGFISVCEILGLYLDINTKCI